MVLYFSQIFFPSGHTHSIWKFVGQRWNTLLQQPKLLQWQGRIFDPLPHGGNSSHFKPKNLRMDYSLILLPTHTHLLPLRAHFPLFFTHWCHWASSLFLGQLSSHLWACDLVLLLLLFSLSLFFFFFRAAPMAFGGSQDGAKLELQLPAYATATASWDPSPICDLHHSSLQCQILNPLSEARDGTHILMDTSQVLWLLSHDWNFWLFFCLECFSLSR